MLSTIEILQSPSRIWTNPPVLGTVKWYFVRKNEQDHLPGLTLAEAGKYTLEVFAPLAIRINESFDKGSHHKQNLMTALLLKGIFPQ